MKTKEENIRIVRAACVAANPELRKVRGSFKGVENVEIRSPRLADVLEAMRASDKCRDGYYSIGSDGGWYKCTLEYPDGNKAIWNFRGIGGATGWSFTEDDLTAQSEETLSFLATLLSETTV